MYISILNNVYCVYIYIYIHNKMPEGSLEVKLPTICRDGKAEAGRVKEGRRTREKIREEKE